MTWKDDCAAIIASVTRHLPADASLAERKAVIARARPYWIGNTSWGEKAWQAARREYLIPFGYQPMTKKAKAARAAGLPLFDKAEDKGDA